MGVLSSFFDLISGKSARIESPKIDAVKEDKDLPERFYIKNGVRYIFPENSRLDITTDPFEKKKRLDFASSGGYGSGKYMFFGKEDSFEFNIGFRSIEDKNYLIYGVYQKDLKLKKGDKLMFIFKDGSAFNLDFEVNAYRFVKELDGVVVESYSFLDKSQIETFAESEIDQMRYASIDGTTNVNLERASGTNKGFQEYARCYKYALDNHYY